VFLLLKSSDFVTYDLHHAYDLCSDKQSIAKHDAYYEQQTVPATSDDNNNDNNNDNNDDNNNIARPNWRLSLVLRQWYHLVAGMEFRCFVGARELLGISQRDYMNYYAFLEPIQNELRAKIEAFFDEQVEPVLPIDDCMYRPPPPCMTQQHQSDPTIAVYYHVLIECVRRCIRCLCRQEPPRLVGGHQCL
jgi:hypothetical protein